MATGASSDGTRRHDFSRLPMVVIANLGLGLIGALCLVFLVSDVTTLILEPLGLVRPEPTANDDPTGLGLLCAAGLAASFWLANKSLARATTKTRVVWFVASLSFALPTLFIVSLLTLNSTLNN